MRWIEERIENVVIGSGAAGFQTLLRLQQKGLTDSALITENVKAGTSRNTGSDKQTYYKLSLAADDQDSILRMARDLFQCGAVDGDLALCEAALSSRAFFRLVELGVPFPCTEYGEFVGYRTDHDPGRRASSAGPYTSKIMTECLEKEALSQGLRIYDRQQAIRLLVDQKKIYGVVCLDLAEQDQEAYRLIWCKNVILATGGPAGMYYDRVYPASQLGSSGMAFEAGVNGKNLTDWQFGIASIRPRWNVSGSYMQVLPTFISTKKDGTDPKEFLLEYFSDHGEMLTKVFLKGYQWPFDVSKVSNGSSLIDLLVYQETVLNGRRVFLDFMHNSLGRTVDFSTLAQEAYDYLSSADLLFGRPIDRLRKLNELAYSFYLEHGVDLEKEPLEIAVCAQHNNGGLATDCQWETNIQGIFAVGEVNGSHGVTRPGGTALNAGQVGAIRVADCISFRKRYKSEDKVGKSRSDVEQRLRQEAESFISLPHCAKGQVLLKDAWETASRRMSESGGMIRTQRKLEQALQETKKDLEHYISYIRRPLPNQLCLFYHLRDMLTSQLVYLSAMCFYGMSGKESRGSSLYTDSNGEKAKEWMPEIFRFSQGKEEENQCIQETVCHVSGDLEHLQVYTSSCFRLPRPIPKTDYTFEKCWDQFRKRTES